jgi:hypothetical protein
VTATLGIYGDELLPHEITSVLRCDPSSAHRRGDPRPNPRCSPYSAGAWILSLQAEAPREPAELVRALLARVETEETVWKSLSDSFDVQVRLGVFLEEWNRGFDLPSDLVAEVARIGASLVFDIYANLEDDDDDADAS